MSSKPWKDDKYKPKRVDTSGPLVPNSAVSTPTQRLVVTSVFFLLQGWKLAGSKTLAHFVGYTTLDVAFVAFLPVLGIPRLRFKRSVTQVQILLLLLFNYTVFIDARWFILALWVITRPLAWLLGISTSKKISSAGQIRGKYVVDILPEASARLDTISPLCIDSRQNQPVYLRLQVENTWPSAVALSKAALGNTSDYENINYSKRQIANMPSEKGKLYIPIVHPGAYYLNTITDEHTGLRVKIQRDRVVVPPCPSAEISLLSNSAICAGDTLQAEIVAHGVAPIKLMVDGTWLTLGESSPEDAVKDVKYVVEKTGVSDSVSVTVGSVSDGLGTASKRQVDSQVSAKVLSSPTARFVRDLRLAKVQASVDAYVDIAGSTEDKPYTVVLETPNGDLSEFTINNSGQQRLSLSQVGKYKLRSLKGAKCAGKTQGEIEVFEPPQVKVSGDFEIIQDKCAGPTAVNAKLNFEGTAPFKVNYRTLKGHRVVSQEVATFDQNQGVVHFRPKDVGEYRYEIVSVEDRYRRIRSDLATTQSITELPGAQFGRISSTKLCGETAVSAEVRIRGRGPFTLNYRIDDLTKYKVTTHDTTDAARIMLDLDLKAGSHFIRLDSLIDRDGCVTDLGGIRSPTIEVIPEIAHIALAEPGTYKSADPVNMTIPVSARNLNYPATLVYEHELDGRKSRFQLTLNSKEDQLHAPKPGMYRLVSLDDGVCGGTVEPNQNVEISLYERPRIVFDGEAATKSGYCLNTAIKSLQAKLHGEPPFTVLHEVLDPTGKSNIRSHKFSGEDAEFTMGSSLPGDYQHYFWVLDMRYPEFNRSHFVEQKHTVWAPAEASFVKGRHTTRVCEDSDSPAELPMALKGTAPLLLDIQVQNSPVQQYVVEDLAHYKLRLTPESGIRIGSNKVKVVRVQDGHGCVSPVPPLLDNANVEVLAAPKPPKLSKTDYCVGDKMTIPLQGHGPRFHIEYMWANKVQSKTLNAPHFERYMNTPGDWNLLSIKDEHGCRVKTNVTAHIHPLPSSTITEEPHFSIYQGDQISLGFAFQGTAPFSFVYTRSVNGKVQEKKSVRNIMENVYTIIVDEGGEYEITELQDKFCRSHR